MKKTHYKNDKELVLAWKNQKYQREAILSKAFTKCLKCVMYIAFALGAFLIVSLALIIRLYFRLQSFCIERF